MGVRRTLGAGVVLVALCLGLPAAALADEDLVPTGAVTIAWHGDPALGCAKVGVCGVHGVEIVRPTDDVTFSREQRHGGQLQLSGASLTVRVSGAGSGTCIDNTGNAFGFQGSIGVAWKRSGALSASLQDLGSSGRCAGPLAGEMAAVSFTGHVSHPQHPNFSLAGTVPFRAGPYSGTLAASLRLVPDTTGGFASSSSSSSSPGAIGHRRKVLYEQVTLRYHVAVPAGALTIPFGGEADPFCAALASCGASGSVVLSVPAARSTLTLQFSRRIGHQVRRRQALADLLARRLGFLGGPGGLPLGVSQVSETIAGPGGLACADSQSSVQAQTGTIGGQSYGGTTPAQLPVLLSAPGPGDFLRTHCPGPAAADAYPDTVFGDGSLAGGTLPLAALLHRHTTVTLSARGSFSGLGYSGSRNGAITVSLDLVKIKTGTVRAPAGWLP